MTSKLLVIALALSLAMNVNLWIRTRQMRRGLQDAARRVRYLGRVLNSHASSRGEAS